MDSRPPRHNSRRPQDVSTAGDSGHSRTLSLSDRVNNYHGKLVENSQSSNTFSSSQTHPTTSSRPNHGFGGADAFAHHRYPDASTVRSFHVSSSHPYTVYVEDSTVMSQRFPRRKSPPLLESASQHLDKCDSSSSKSCKSKSISPTNAHDSVPCPMCGGMNHSPGRCPMRKRLPAEQDNKASSSQQCNQLESSTTFEISTVNETTDALANAMGSSRVGLRKDAVPSSSMVKYERDVIGQERSPVLKSQPSSSNVLSPSSSNGDSVPRERKKWVRPPLVGQASSSADKPHLLQTAAFDCPVNDMQDVTSDQRRKASNEFSQLSSSTGSEPTDPKGSQQQKGLYFDSSSDGASGLLLSRVEYFSNKEKAPPHQVTSEGEQGLSDSCAGGRVSPSSSVTSGRRLEWDSGADVGYNQAYGSADRELEPSGLCTIERMALTQGCSVALRLRLDPEGTTVPSPSTVTVPVPPTPQQVQSTNQTIGKPSAESTPIERGFNVSSHVQGRRNDQKIGISPISSNLERITEDQQAPVSHSETTGKDAEDKANPEEAPIMPVQRQWSNSLQDLRKCSKKMSGKSLYKSQSDPDLAADLPAVELAATQSKHSDRVHRRRNWPESNVAVQSVSSGSDATLVHVEAEEDAYTGDVRKCTSSFDSEGTTITSLNNRDENHHSLPSLQGKGDNSERVLKLKGQEELKCLTHGQPTSGNGRKSPSHSFKLTDQQSLLKKHGCSDTDHQRGLHHHFGVLCSTAVGGHIQSNIQPNAGSELQNCIHGPDRVYASVDDGDDGAANSHGKYPVQEKVTCPPRAESEPVTADSATSSALHSDAAHEDALACGNTLTGRANSFEYLPGHIYENNNSGPGCSRQEQPPGISTSTETDSEPARSMTRVINRGMADSSSLDTEEDRLWGSPRGGSNTLVQDLERGLHLLKGVMENRSAGRRSKRELLRRVIQRLVSSDYVDDLIDKERLRHRPHSPKRTKLNEWHDRHLRSKRGMNSERQEVSGESDEPKQRAQNYRKKLSILQTTPASQGQRMHSILPDGSKSSSLWSSLGDSTSGSISLSGSSDHQKTSKSSMKPNPSYRPEGGVSWMEAATESEKLFLLRNLKMVDADHGKGGASQKLHEDAVRNYFLSDTKKQLFWVKSEINHLKMVKQLLKKQESGKQILNPKACGTTLTALPITSIKHTVKMTDCASPDAPDGLSGRRMQPWQTLESGTSAYGAQSNSSRDSRWRDIEIASAGEQDGGPHRTVSISDGDENSPPAAAAAPAPAPAPGLETQRARRRSMNAGEVGHRVGAEASTMSSVRKKRSECLAESSDGRICSSRPAAARVQVPAESNYSSEGTPRAVTDTYVKSRVDSKHACSCGRPAPSTGSQSTSSRSDTPGPQTSDGRPPLRLHVHVDQPDSMDSQTAPYGPDNNNFRPVVRSASEDSVTKAVTEAVSAKVRALRNLVQVEEAEVKIRLKVGQTADEAAIRNAQSERVWKSQDLEDDRSSFVSKQTEMEEMIARQRALDQETRHKLLAIAESRQRNQSGTSDSNHKIQDLLLQDYLRRHQGKVNEGGSGVARVSPTRDYSDLPKKTVGTSTAKYMYENYSQTQEALGSSVASSQCSCSCRGAVGKRVQVRPPPCSCQQPRGRERVSRPSSAERHVEFELQLTKQPPRHFSALDVHKALKDRNTAYFLQFEEDESLQKEEPAPSQRPPLSVVTVRVPKPKHTPARVRESAGHSQAPRNSREREREGQGEGEAASAHFRRKSLDAAEATDSPAENSSPPGKSSSEGLQDAANMLRGTPGRSHLSITVTESSVDSVRSPDGDSRSSSVNFPSRKLPKSPRSPRRFGGYFKRREARMEASGRRSGKVFQTMAFRAGTSSSVSSSASQPVHAHGDRQPAPDGSSLSDCAGDGDLKSVLSLQEYLEINYPEYLSAAEKRRRCIAEMSYLRRLRQQSRKRLLELEGDSLRAKHRQLRRFRCASRPKPVLRKRTPVKNIRAATAKKCFYLPEVQQRLAELKRKEENKTNRLMAEIYTRKLQEKVLKGTTTIRSSVSVISNF